MSGEGPLVPPGGGLTPAFGASSAPQNGVGSMGFAQLVARGLGRGASSGAPVNYGERGPLEGMRPIEVIQLTPRAGGNDFTGFPNDAYRLSLPYPAILQAQSRTTASADQSLTNFFYAVPFTREVRSNPNGLAGIGIGGQYVAVRSKNAGIMYLPAGEWYLYYPENNLLTIGVFDARDQLFAAWMLQQYGQHANSRHTSDTVLNNATPNATVLEANKWRSMVILQNTSIAAAGVNNSIRVGFTTAPLGLPNPRGIQLLPGASLTLAAESLILDQVQVCREDLLASATVCNVCCWEWL